MESAGVVLSGGAGPEASNPIIAIEREPVDQLILTSTAGAVTAFHIVADDASGDTTPSVTGAHSSDPNASSSRPPGFLSADGGGRRSGSGGGAHSVVLSEAAYSACAVASSVGVPDDIDSVRAPHDDISDVGDVEEGSCFDDPTGLQMQPKRSSDRVEHSDSVQMCIERMHLEGGNGGPPDSRDSLTAGFRGGGGGRSGGGDLSAGSGSSAFVRRIRARLDAGSSKLPLEMQSSDPIPQDDPSDAVPYAEHNVRVWSVRSHSCPILLFSWLDAPMSATCTAESLDPNAEIAAVPRRKRSHTTHGGPVTGGKVGRKVRGPQRRLLMHSIARRSHLTKQFSGSDQALRYPSVSEDSATRVDADDDEGTQSHRNSVFSMGEAAPPVAGLAKGNARKLNSIASNSSIAGASGGQLSGSGQYRSENQLYSEGLGSRASTSGLCAAAASSGSGALGAGGALGLILSDAAAVRQDSLPVGVGSGPGCASASASASGSRVSSAVGVRPGLGPGGLAAYEPIASPVPLRQSRDRKWCEEWVQQLRRMHTLPSSDRPQSTSDSTTSDCHTPKNF